MSRERGARASISRSVAHGLVGWGCLLCIAAGILVTRLHTAEAGRAPLLPVPVRLSAADYRAWTSFPDYHKVVPVLMYHSIGGRASYLTVSRKLFAEQMRALKVAGFHTLTIQQYAHFVGHGYRGLPSRPILLTFDDGRLDAYRAANDLLRSYGFHATELVVPSWVSGNPKFSLSWSQLTQMSQGSTWNVQLHFGYGREEIHWDKTGDTGAAFAYLQYFPGQPGQPGHQETFAQYRHRIANNMVWGARQLEQKVPGYKPWSMAIPESDYGQAGTNDDKIPPFVLGWLDRHFPVVFGGDYLDKAMGRRFQINGRFSPKLSYRMSLGPLDTLAVLHCRLWDFAHRVPIWEEYGCQRLAGTPQETLAAMHPPIHPRAAASYGPPPPPRPHVARRLGARIDPRSIRGPRVVIGSRPGWRVVIRRARGSSAGTPPRHG